MSRRSGPAVISATGSRDTRLVGAFRLASATCTGAALVAIAELFGGAGVVAGVLAGVLALAAGAFAAAEISYGGRAARAEERRIRADLLRRQFDVGSRPTTRDGAPSAAGVIQLMTDNTERVTEYRQVYFGATLAAMAIPFVTLAYVAVAIDWVVGLVVMLLVPFIPILIRGFMLLFRKSSADSRRQRGILAGRYLDAIRNLVTIRLLGAGERIEHDLRVQGEANRGAIMRLLAGNQVVIIVMDGLFSLLLICATAGLTVTRAEHLSTADLLAVMLLTVLLLEPLQQVAGFFYIGMGGMASKKAIAAYLRSTQQSSPDAADAASNPEGPVRHPNRSVSPVGEPMPGLAIELRGVHHDYGRGEVLRGVDLEVPIGARVALVGRSGAGKSTLLGLVRGSLPPQRGLIAVGGRLLDPSDPAATRALNATVGQSTWLFTGTIADNLRMARPDATAEEMWDALARAHVADEVRRMPGGIDSQLGEGAILVSGGQAQRFSLARALLSGRKILLLDEPTSQVDIESEARIIEAVAELPREWTILMVTHRPSLLRIADTVHELSGGRLTAREVEHV